MAKKYPEIIGESKKGKKPPLRKGCPDDFQTPPEALNPLLRYLKKEWVIWECACGNGNLSDHLKKLGYKVIATDILTGQDFLTYEPENYDCIITNPPYSLKDQFLERAYSLGKPFAFLLPITAFEGKRRQALFVQNGLEIILFNKRINFETPSGHGSSSWFATAWFTNGLKIGRQITWVDLSSVPRELDLTHSPRRANIPPAQERRGVFCMKGGIYTKEKCPVCGKKFDRGENDLLCFRHQTRPKKYFIKLYTKELKKNICLYSDSRGNSFSSYEQANRILTKIRAEIDAGSFDASRYVSQKLKPLKFRNWSSAWLERRRIEAEKKLIAPSYFKELKRYVRIFQNHFGDTDIRDIGTKKVNDFYLTLNGSPKYILNILSCLHKMLLDALDWEEIKKMPKFPKIEVPEPDFKTIDLDQQDAIIEKIKDPMDKAYILFTAREMVRPSETRALFWDDLDFKHNQVTIRRHFSLNEIRLTTKSRRIKSLPLDTEVKEALMKLPRYILVDENGKQYASPFVFQKKGRPYSESYARKLWTRITSEMGTKISFYRGTRHSSATEAVNRVGMDKVQEFLGHTRSTMTRRYAKMNAEGLRPVLRK